MVSKKELMAWLEKRKISYFTDPTNLDSKYLRGRLRTSIIPQLEASFGKSIVKNLCLLGERAQKIEEHFRKEISGVQNAAELEGPLLEFFLKAESERQGKRLSRNELQVLVRKVNSGLALKIRNDYLNH